MGGCTLVRLAVGGGVVRAVALLIAFAADCCMPTLTPPVVPDAPYDGGCALSEAITEARLIRTDSGAPLVVPCPEAGP